MKRILIFAIVLLSLGAAALAVAQDSDDMEVMEIEVIAAEEVINEDLEVTGITDSGGRLAITTSIPMACVLVYGETDAFGNLVLDSLMGAAAHSEHEIILSGLEPDTEYFYRVQGSDEDGNLYRSATYSFRTAPASNEANNNLLSPENGATVTDYSSIFGDGPEDGQWGVLNAIDDDPLTEWSSDGDGNDAYIEIQLAQESQINEIVFQTRAMSSSAEIFAFEVTTGDGETYGPFELEGPDTSYSFEVDIVAETLRFGVADSNGGNTGIVDVAAFGEATE